MMMMANVKPTTMMSIIAMLVMRFLRSRFFRSRRPTMAWQSCRIFKNV
jgi:hypothetical protein